MFQSRNLGQQLPGLLRDFLIEGKTIKEVFVSQGFHPMTNMMRRLPGRGVEIADQFLAQAPHIAWFYCDPSRDGCVATSGSSWTGSLKGP